MTGSTCARAQCAPARRGWSDLRQGQSPVADAWDSIDGPGGTYTLRDLARTLLASRSPRATGTTYETGPQFTTTLQRVGWTRAWSGDAGLGFQDLTVRIAPTPTP